MKSPGHRFIAAAESNYKLRKFAREELREEAFPPLTVTLLDAHGWFISRKGALCYFQST